jgi:chemotaxis signal transduction protein
VKTSSVAERASCISSASGGTRNLWRSHHSLHEIVRVPEITAVPDAPDYLEGVINLRGKIVSVIDLRKRLGEAPGNTSTAANRILVVEHKGRLSGLIVDSASEVIKIPRATSNPLRMISRKAGCTVSPAWASTRDG